MTERKNTLPFSFETPSVFLFTGSTKAGKTHSLCFVLRTLWQAGHFQHGWVFSPSINNPRTGGDYINMISNRSALFDQPPSETQILKIVQYQQQKAKENNGDPPRAFIVIDDSLGLLDWKTGIMQSMLARFRHLGLSVFLTTQWTRTRACCPLIRAVADYVFAFPQASSAGYAAIQENFCPHFDSLKDFKEFHLDATKEPFSCLLIRKDVADRDRSQKYLKFLAPAKGQSVRIDF
jgi:hypothetical protein